MKKLLSILLAAMLLVSVAGIQANAYTGHVNDGDTPQFNGATSENIFGDLINWDGVVFGDVNNIIDSEGTLAVYGSFNSSRGFSVNNGAYGANPASTENVAFLVNDYVNIAGYGDVYGQTVVGGTEGNTYRLTNTTPSGTTNGTYTVADATQYFTAARSTATAAKTAIAALPANGVCEAENGTYTFVGNADAETLVYNVSDSDFNAYLFDFTIAEGQTIVVNLTSPDKLNFKNGGVRINGSMEPDVLRSYNRNIVINVTRSNEIEMTSCELYGILVAPDTELTGSNANVCGTSILNSLTGLNGFELHVGSNNTFVPKFVAADVAPEVVEEPTDEVDPDELLADGKIRIDVSKKMAVVFEDGTVYYGGEMRDFVFGEEYSFRMCAVNWANGIYDGNENGLCGTVVYRMKVVHRSEFNQLAAEAKQNPDRYIVKGIDIIDTESKMIIVDGNAEDTHLETDVNSFFVAYRFHFAGEEEYDKKTGIDKVVNDPIESLSVNLPAGSTITCNAYINGEKVNTADIFITTNSGEGVYDDEYLTSVNDYTWE